MCVCVVPAKYIRGVYQWSKPSLLVKQMRHPQVLWIASDRIQLVHDIVHATSFCVQDLIPHSCAIPMDQRRDAIIEIRRHFQEDLERLCIAEQLILVEKSLHDFMHIVVRHLHVPARSTPKIPKTVKIYDRRCG